MLPPGGSAEELAVYGDADHPDSEPRRYWDASAWRMSQIWALQADVMQIEVQVRGLGGLGPQAGSVP